MADPRRPSSTRFVIQGIAADDAKRLLGDADDVATCQPLTDTQDLLELELVEEAEASDSRDAWRRVRNRVAPECEVLPVLEDEDGGLQYPTGAITIRFARPIEDAEIADFATAHGLRCQGRNEYQPLQATFTTAPGKQTYLPDVMATLDADERTYAAWPEVVLKPKRDP